MSDDDPAPSLGPANEPHEPDDAESAASPGDGLPAPKAALFRFVPALDSLREYSLRSLWSDAVAGLTVAAVSVPQSMAYALAIGLPPQNGLYTAIVITAVGALFNSSKHLLKAPTNVVSIALMSALGTAAFASADDKVTGAVLMALLVGAIQLGIALLRLGDLTRYVSHAVVLGFTFGASVLLVLEQLKNLVGLRAVGEHTDHFLKRFARTLSEGGPIHGWTVAIGVGSIALVLVLGWLNRRMACRMRLRFRVPEFLVTVIVMGVLVWVLGLDKSGVKVVGAIPRELPRFVLPLVEWQTVRELSGSALAIALLGLLEAISMSKSIAARTGQKLDINQQGLSEGISNLTGSFFQCFPGSGSLSRSTINFQSGAVSQWSGVIAAAAVATIMLSFAPLARYIPRAALAGILIVAAWRTVDPKQLMYYLRATRFDAGILLATALASVAVSVEFCILIGTFLSFVFYVPRAARLHLSELTLTAERVIRERLKTDPPCSRILIFNLEGELFFGSSPDLDLALGRMEQRAVSGVRVLVLRVKRVRNPDAVCFAMIEQFLERMETRGVTVLLCGVRHDVSKVLRNLGLEERLGPGRIFREVTSGTFSTPDAVRHAYELLGDDLCENCPRRQGKPGRADGWYYMI